MHSVHNLFILLITILLLSACSPKNKKVLIEKPVDKSIDLPERKLTEIKQTTRLKIEKPAPTLLLSMSQEDCLGKCPVFKWTLISDGKMKYTGEKDVDWIGTYEGLLTEEQVNTIKAKALEIGLLSMSNRYPVRGKVVEEVPATILYFRHQGQSKSIVNKHHAPKELLTFQQYLLGLIDKTEWRRVRPTG